MVTLIYRLSAGFGQKPHRSGSFVWCITKEHHNSQTYEAITI